MSDSFEISKAPLAGIGEAEVRIIDEYFLHLKDADCVRTITYYNKGNNPIPVDLTAIKFAFFPTCENFNVEINGVNKPELLTEDDPAYYSRVIKINFTENQLLPAKKIEIKISCKWKNFVSWIDDCFFTVTYPDRAKYSLILHGLNPENRPYLFHIGDREAIKDTDYFLATDSVIFNDVDLDRNNPLRVKMLILSTARKLPTLNYFSTTNKINLSGYIVILIQHLLSDFIHLVDAFLSSRVDKSHVFIVGIPYSTKDKTVKYLKLKGYENLEIPLVYPFDEQVRSTMRKAIEVSKSNGKKILIVEDGGYAVPILHKEFIGEGDRFIGAVEQTSNGIWRDEEILEKYEIPYCIPIIDVARSNIKLRLESPLIGRAVCRNIELLLGKEFLEISGKKVGVTGFGSTGSRIAKTIKDMGAQLTIYSDNSIDLNFAHNEGYKIAHNGLELVKSSNIIIEATGREWAGADEITALQNGTYFVSASSKRMGIKYNEFEGLIDKDKTVNLPGIGVKYHLTTGNTVTLLADGFPVNFFDSESVPDKAIEFIPTILFESAKFLINKKDVVPKGIIGFAPNKTDSDKIKNIKEELNKLEKDIAHRHLMFKEQS